MRKIMMLSISILVLYATCVNGNTYTEMSNNNLNEKEMRLRINNVEPKVYDIMIQFEKYLSESDLSKTHKELLKIRASQLNNCGYCLNMHSQEALKAGESDARIYMLPLWKTVPHFYTEEEQVILQMTEEMTFIKDGLSDQTYDKAMALFSENYVAQLMTAIIVINAWNRIGVATHMEDECTL